MQEFEKSKLQLVVGGKVGVGNSVGCRVVGYCEGATEGCDDGSPDGPEEGFAVGGVVEGLMVGILVPLGDGAVEGYALGT